MGKLPESPKSKRRYQSSTSNGNQSVAVYVLYCWGRLNPDIFYYLFFMFMTEEILQLIPAQLGTIAVFKEPLSDRWEIWAERIYCFGLVKHTKDGNEWRTIEPFINGYSLVGLESALADTCFGEVSFLADVSDEALKEFGKEQSILYTNRLLENKFKKK